MVGASLAGVPGCTDEAEGPEGNPVTEPAGTYSFPQGVASGDPRAASVVLWTRVTLAAGTGTFASISLRVQVSNDASFGTLVVDQAVMTAQSTDHTVRVLVTGLAAATSYYYRFVAGKDSISGRTRTAPAADADVQVNLAWVSCQDYTAGHYGAYRQLLVDDDARAEADKIHAVVHLGDMIYETRGDLFQTAIDDNFTPIALTNRDGKARTIPAFPSGGGTRANVTFAATVEDYRHLYRTFLSDPDLQAARARWPFISIWDDHEFTDDCWQSQANYTRANSTDEGDQTRRVAASQAWFEYVPVQLSGAGSVKGVDNPAKDFQPTKVDNAAFTTPNADNFVAEPNNAAAVGAITIYRSLRFGKHVELVMTDQRSYRSDHAVPEELTNNPAFPAPRNAVALPFVTAFDQGKTANNNNPDVNITVGPVTLPNLRFASPPGTMLGKAQKAWWKAVMKGSDATWKLWGSEVMLMRLLIQQPPGDIAARVISADAWDGYPTERKELMSFLKDNSIQNVVVLSGDIHASFGGVIVDDFDAALVDQHPVAFELTAAGISSNSLFSFFEAATRPPNDASRPLITVDRTAAGGARFTENMNMLLLHGLTSAGAVAQGAPVEQALALSDPAIRTNMRYVDTNSQGYGYVKVTGAQITATIVTINRPIVKPTDAGPGIKRTATFVIPKTSPAAVADPAVTGTLPFPLLPPP